MQSTPSIHAEKNRVLALANANRLTDAKELCARLCQSHRSDAELWLYLGAINGQLGQFAESEACMRQVIAISPDHPGAHYNLGLALSEQGKTMQAVAAYEQALRLKPDYEDARGNLNKLYNMIIPRWHFPMLNDALRNDAYDQAIRKAVTPESVVLDIGSGSGLLAMMAARAGAKRIVTCEMVPPIAARAAEIVRHNGLHDRITVIGKKSTNLKLGVDLPERANLLISEILDIGVLGEGVAGAVEHARANLLTPDVKMIPRSATVYAVLVESEAIHQENYVSTASGFDVGLFNDFSTMRYLPMRLDNYPHRTLSDPFEVFHFDFCGPAIRSEEKQLRVPGKQAGRCHAVAFWFRLSLDDEIFIDTSPANERCWTQAVQIFRVPFSIRQHEDISLRVKHNCSTIYFSHKIS